MSSESSSHLNPFPGLRPFRSDEHHLFFGREEQTAELLGLLRTHRFLAIVGTSGSGKSSLVRAGLIPALHRGTMTQAGSTWEVVILRPGGNPVTKLAQALLGANLYDQEDPESLPRLRATLNRSLFGLVEAIRQSDQVDPATNLLVVVDQFEEVFRFRQQSAQSEETTSAFVGLLLAAAQQQQQRIYVTITMRSDYLGDCSHLPGLAEAVNRGEYLIPRLLRDQQREAIEKPVGVGGTRIAPRLVQRMLNDVGDDLDQLPVLQHALMRTWDAWSHAQADEKPLDLQHYEATGGMEEALSRHADEVYNSLPDAAHQRVCQRLFKTLTEYGADDRGVRRPTQMKELHRISGTDRGTVTTVIDAYRAPGVTFLMPTLDHELVDRAVVDLSHESLMRVWRRLRAWAVEEAQSARVYRRLAESAVLWREGNAGLYRDPDLQIALRWRDTAEPNSAWAEQYGGRFDLATQFLDQSREAAEAEAREQEAARRHELEQAHALARAQDQQRAAKRMMMLAAGIAAVGMFGIVALVVAVAARRDAIQNAQLAEENAGLAQQNAVLAQQKEQAATEAKTQLQQTLAKSDFNVGVEKIQAGDGAEGLMHLARAMRTDDSMWPAGVRAMSTLASGQFSLECFEPIEQKRAIVDYRFNDAENLLFTWDIREGVDLPAGELPEAFVWDALTGKQLYQVAPGKRLAHPRWTEDGSLLFGYLPAEKRIQAWDARTGRTTGPTITLENSAERLHLGSDRAHGNLLLVRYHHGTLQVWKAASGETLTPRLGEPASSFRYEGFTPDGRCVYSNYGHQLSVWETVGGTPVQQFSGEPHTIAYVYWSPGGETAVAQTVDQQHITWWNVGKANTESSWLEFDHKVAVAFLRDESKVVFVPIEEQPNVTDIAVYDLNTRQRTASIEPEGRVNRFVQRIDRDRIYRFPIIGTVEANDVRIWDLKTGEQLQRIDTPTLLADAKFSPEGRRVATTSEGHEVRIWDVFTGRPLLRESIRHRGSVTGPVFSADGERLVTHDAETRMVRVWNSRTGELVAQPVEQAGSIMPGTFFTSCGRRLLLMEAILTASSGTTSIPKRTTGRFQLVDVGMRPALAETLLNGTEEGASARFVPDGNSIVVYGQPGTSEHAQIMVFDSGSRRLQRTMPLPQGAFGDPRSLQVTADGSRVLLSCGSAVRLWELVTGAVVQELSVEGSVTCAAFNKDGSLVAAGTRGGKVYVWDAASGACLFDPLDSGDQIRTILFTPDSSLVAFGSEDFKFRFADARTGEPSWEPLEMDNVFPGYGSTCSPDGTHIAAVPFSNRVRIVGVTTGKVVRELEHADACRKAAFSPDGQLLAVGTGGRTVVAVGEVILWNWRDGTTVGRPMDAKGAVGLVRFSQDGELLATGTYGNSGAVQVWHVASGQPLTHPVVGRSSVAVIDFNPAGTEVVAGWYDGTARVVEIPSRRLPTPQWLPRLAEAVAGHRMVPGRESVQEVAGEELEALRVEIVAHGDGSSGEDDTRWGRWFFSAPDSRSVSPNSTLTFGQYLSRLRQSEVIDELQQALMLAPSDALTHARLAQVLLDSLDEQNDLGDGLRRHWQDTVDWYSRRSLELEPKDPNLWALRWQTLRSIGKIGKAESAAARALELVDADVSRASANAHYASAVTLADEGRWAEADDAFRAALELMQTASAEDDPSPAAAPLLGVLLSLRPVPAPTEFRDLRLPEPIPGTFEDFESVAEGKLPAGWTVRSEAPVGACAVSRLDATDSDAFQDWTTISADRVSRLRIGERILAVAANERTNGILQSPLVNGRFLCGVSANRPWSQVQYISTPDFDCSARTDVHVAFHSLYEQAPGSVACLEYSVDEGNTWLPVVYMMDSAEIIYDQPGKIDAVATLKKQRDGIPWFIDQDGGQHGGCLGAFVNAPLGPELAPFIKGLPKHNPTESMGVEVVCLPQADGQPRVRLRFAYAGSNSWYWGIDDFGLYEIGKEHKTQRPDDVSLADAPKVLAGLGIAKFLGREPRPGIRAALAPQDFLAVKPPDAPADPESPATASLASGSDRRRIIDAALLVRRAAALAPDDPWIALASATVLPRAGELEKPIVPGAQVPVQRPFSRFLGPPVAAFYVSRGDALQRDGAAEAALVCYEIAYLLFRTATGKVPPELKKRLADAGAVAEDRLLLPRGSEWSYFDQGTDPGPEWKERWFDDTAWPRGQARLGYGGDGEKTRVGFGPDPRRRYVTTYFRARFELDHPEAVLQLKLRLQRDDGIVVYVNGQEAARDNMPAGIIGPNTFAIPPWADREDETAFHEFDVVAPQLRRGVNVVAAEIHQGYFTSSDIGFDLEIEAIGGLNDTMPAASVLEKVEEQLGIPDELRSVLWTSRAERFRVGGKLDEATEALQRAARLGLGNPGVAYQRALLLHARGDEEAAYQAYVEAVKGAIALKADAPSPYALLLPKALNEPLEPLLEPTAVGLAEAAGRELLSETESRWLLRWSRTLDADDCEARRERAESLLKLGLVDEALSAANAGLAAGTPDAAANETAIRQYKDWLNLQERCLRLSGKTDEADRARDELVAAPLRDLELSPKLIDLSKHYNASLYDHRGLSVAGRRYLRMLPETFRPRNGIDFDLRGLIHLNSGIYPDDRPTAIRGKDVNAVVQRQYPDQVTGIRVHLKTRAFHFLTSTNWGDASSGETVARFVIHYEDGSQAEVPVRFDEDVINWANIQKTNPRRDVWLGRDPPCCLSDKTWQNPHPDKKISHLDFISEKKTAAPFLVAITAE